jgi:hypothetical protein
VTITLMVPHRGEQGPAIEHLQKKHNLRPFLLDVYKIDYHFGDR